VDDDVPLQTGDFRYTIVSVPSNDCSYDEMF